MVKNQIEEQKEKMDQDIQEQTHLEQIKNDIALLKEDTKALDSKVADFEKNKDKLSKEETDKLKKEIEEEWNRIEEKKQALLTLIKQTKGELDVLKWAISDSSEKSELEAMEKDLTSLNVKKWNFWEKLKETGKKALNYVKEHPWKSLLIASGIASGVGLAIWGISRLFKKRKEKKENSSSSDSEKPWFFKRTLKWLGIGVGWILLWKNRDTIKAKFGDLWNWITGKKNENAPGDGQVASWSFEHLAEDEQQKYLTLMNQIDEYSGNNLVTFDQDETKNTTLKWKIIFWLDKNVKNLSEFWNNDMLNYITAKTDRDWIDQSMDWLKEKWYKYIGPYITSLASFASFLPKFATDPLNAINEWLEGGKDREQELALYFKEYMNILIYVQSKKNLLLEHLAAKELWFSWEITEDQKDAIEKCIDNPSWCKKQLEQYNLVDLADLLQENNIEVYEDDTETKEIKEDCKDNRNDIFDVDDNWEDVFYRSESDFLDWTLDISSRNELIDFCDDFGDDMFGTDTKKWFFSSYIHLITDIFKGNTECKDQLFEKIKLKDLVNEIQTKLITYKEKLKNGTFTQQDLTDLKTKANEYFDLKEHYELALHQIEKWSDDADFDWKKIPRTLVQSFLDIGKIFGSDDQYSRWWKLWASLWWLYISWQTVYILGNIKWSSIITGLGKLWIVIWQAPLTLAKKSINLALGRTFLTWYEWEKYILRSSFDGAEQERILKYAFLRWEIDEHRAIRIAQGMKSESFKNIDNLKKLLTQCWITDSIHQWLFEKYQHNSNLRKILFTKDRYKIARWEHKLDYKIFNRTAGWDVTPNTVVFNELQKIDSTLEWLQWSQKTFAQTFLNHVKSLDRVDDLFKNSAKLSLISDLSTLPNSANHAKILAKNFHKFSNLWEFEKYLEFLKANKNNITNFDNFIINSIGKHKDILSNPSKYEATKLLKMNQSAFEKQIEWMKKIFSEAANKLKNKVVPKQFQSKIDKAVADLRHLSTISSEDFKLLRFWSTNQHWVKEMKDNKKLISSLQKAFDKPWFANAIKDAKTVDWLKNVFKNNARITSDLPDGFFDYLFKNKNAWNVDDVLKYVNKVDEIGKIGKILTSPYMKVAWKLVGRIIAVAGPVMGWITAFMTYQEAREISKHNQERWDFKRQKWHWEMTMAVLWWVDSTIAILWTFSVIWAPVAWLVSGIMTWVLWLAEGIKYYAYDSFDKYSKNYLDFAGESSLVIKQHISTVLMGKNKIDTWLGDVVARQFKNMAHLADKTSGEWIKALLYTQEREKNPLAMENTNDVERMKQLSALEPPVTREMIIQAQNEVDHKVNEKYAYFEKKCGTITIDGKTVINLQKIITPDIIAKGKSMNELDKMLRESEFSIHNLDVDVNVYKSKLDAYPDKYKQLETLWNNDIKTLMYFHRFSYDYKQLMENYLIDDQWNSIEDKKEVIDQNLEYINEFISYKTLTTGRDISLLLPSQYEENDMEKIRDFLITLSIDKIPSSKEIFWSDNTFQNVLYRIATEVIGVRIQNTKEDLLKIFNEENEKKYGIYFKEWDFNRLCINGNYFSDGEYIVDALNIAKFKEDLQKKVNDNDLIDIWTWDKILNKEIGEHYLAIINEEIKRK